MTARISDAEDELAVRQLRGRAEVGSVAAATAWEQENGALGTSRRDPARGRGDGRAGHERPRGCVPRRRATATSGSSSPDRCRPLCQGAADLGPPARVAAARGPDLAAMTRRCSRPRRHGDGRAEGREGLRQAEHGDAALGQRNLQPVSARRVHEARDPGRGRRGVPARGRMRGDVGDGSQMPRFDWNGATTLDRSTNLAREAERLNARYPRTVRLACLDVDTAEWVEVPTDIARPRGGLDPRHGRDRVISVPVAKTHHWAHLTLSLKNFIGITPLERYGW